MTLAWRHFPRPTGGHPRSNQLPTLQGWRGDLQTAQGAPPRSGLELLSTLEVARSLGPLARSPEGSATIVAAPLCL